MLVRSGDWTDDDLRSAMRAYVEEDERFFYQGRPSLSQACAHFVGIEAISSVQKYFKKHVAVNVVEGDAEATKKLRLAKINELKTHGVGNPTFRGQGFFTSSERQALAETVRLLSNRGFKISVESFQGYCRTTQRKILEDRLAKDVRAGIIEPGGVVTDAEIDLFGDSFISK